MWSKISEGSNISNANKSVGFGHEAAKEKKAVLLLELVITYILQSLDPFAHLPFILCVKLVTPFLL